MKLKAISLFFFITLSTLSTSARIFNVNAKLNGANVVPANATTATGTLTGTFDDATGVLNVTIAHINVPLTALNDFDYSIREGTAGTNGTVVFEESDLLNPFSFTITVSNISKVLAGYTYVQVVGGAGIAIRGQINLTPEIFNNAAQGDFFGIGGYSFSKQFFFDGGVRPNPDIITGPSPQNDFSYSVSSTGGIQYVETFISTQTVNRPIKFEFNNNNVRKFGCRVTAFDISTGNSTTEIINIDAVTNLGNVVTVSGSSTDFVGVNVLGENEYIISVLAYFASTTPSTNSIGIHSIIAGDNTPQNVALNFDGNGDYVEIPNTVGNFGTNDNFTVSCWFKPDPSGTNVQCLLDKWNGVAGNGYAFTIRYNATAGTVLAGQFDGSNFPSISSSTSLKDGKWHHVAFAKNSGTLSLYIDGDLIGNATDNATGVTTNSIPLNIGRQGNGIRHFKGEIDEVRIWTVGKTATEIANERFCKTPNTTNLQASYNFNNGVPFENNVFITQIQNSVGTTNHGTINGLVKTGEVSNFVMGQVKYVKSGLISGNGSSWAEPFNSLQSALDPTTCNDLFEVFVAKGTASYKPHANDINAFFNIPTGMRIYGGFEGTEKSINQRNMALIHSTNKTTLSGDLSGNDTPFNFTTNRTDNTNIVVRINAKDVVFDGFTVSGSKTTGDAGIVINKENVTIKNSRVIDNNNFGMFISGNNAVVANCSVLGNNHRGITISNATVTIKESLIANNRFSGCVIFVTNLKHQTTITNSTIVSNEDKGIVVSSSATSTNIIKNCLIHGNSSGGINSITVNGGTIANTVTHSLVQGDAGGANGNLNGNTVNPQFVSPLANNVRSDAGDYRLKWCSLAINAGDNGSISPLDLDRNPRNFNGTADMGAYEFLGNKPSQVNNSTITGTINSPIYAGGAIQTITSDAKILAPAGAIDFKAPNSITLNPGFEARGMSSYFKAEIGANQTCSN